MSYALTDAGESDLKKELRVLDTLVQDIDQLASEARDWKSGSSSCGHVDLFVCKSYTPGKEGWCDCCAHFVEMRNLAVAVERML